MKQCVFVAWELIAKSINVSGKNCTDGRINCIACVSYLNKVFGTLRTELCVCYFISIVETISNALFTPFLLVSLQTELLRPIVMQKQKTKTKIKQNLQQPSPTLCSREWALDKDAPIHTIHQA